MNFDAINFAALRNVFYVKRVTETTGTQSTANSSWVTLVSMTGKGLVFMLRLATSPSATSPSFRVTIDGGTPLTMSANPMKPSYTRGSSVVTWPLAFDGIPFNSSLLVEFMQTSVTSYSGTANVVWGDKS